MPSSCSTNTPTGHARSGHTHRRLRHTIRTGRPERRRVDQRTSTRPCPCATTPHDGSPSPPDADSTVTVKPATVVTIHADHVQAVQADQQVTTVAVATQARQHNVGSLIVEVLEIRRGRSPLILGDLDPNPASAAHRRVVLTPHSTAKSPDRGRIPADIQAAYDKAHA
jgi:hypothetical protein